MQHENDRGASVDGGTVAHVCENMLRHMEDAGVRNHDYMGLLHKWPYAVQRARMADHIHLLTLMHHEPPLLAQLVDLAAQRLSLAPVNLHVLARFQTAESLALEQDRRWLMDLMLHFGPSPLNHERIRAEKNVRRLRQTLVTLLQSERLPCALGAMVALACQTAHIRRAMAQALSPMGLVHPAGAISGLQPPPDAVMAALLSAFLDGGPAQRALCFGMLEVSRLHVALLDILKSRQAPRLP